MLEVKVEGMAVVKKRFKEMQDKSKNPRHAMDVIGAKAFKDVINSFAIEENEDGQAWAKFKDPKTGKRISRRPTKRGGTKLLQDTGRLRNSIRWAANNLEARVFTKVKYAGYHEYGKNAMHRSFMWVNARLRLQFMKDLLDFIKG